MAEQPKYISCANCCKRATSKCKECYSTMYCGEYCRQSYFNTHKKECPIQSLINILSAFNNINKDISYIRYENRIHKSIKQDKNCEMELDDMTRILYRNDAKYINDKKSLISCGNSIDINHIYSLQPIYVPMKDKFGRTNQIEILQQMVLIENNKITAVAMPIQDKTHLQKCIDSGEKIDTWYTYAANKDEPDGISAIIPKTYNNNSWIICCKEEIGEPVTVCAIIYEECSKQYEWSKKIWNTIPIKKIYNIINNKTQPEIII